MFNLMFQRLDRIRLMVSQFSWQNLERNFRILLQPYLLSLDEAREKMTTGMSSLLLEKRHKIELLAQAIQSHSPVEILKRGYAVVIHEKTKQALVSSEQVEIDDRLDIRLHRGGLKALVKEKRE